MTSSSPDAAPEPLVDPAITPDDKDWTWTLRERCPDCGFLATDVAPADIARHVTASTAPWEQVLTRSDATARPDPATWSPLEYACHVRDVCRLFEQRARLMLELIEAAAGLAGVYAGVAGQDWERTGIRSNGSLFTAATLGQYGLHDLVHHLWDVGVDLG